MATKKGKSTTAFEDRAQFSVLRVTQTAADTTTVIQFPTSQTIRDKVGIEIQAIEAKATAATKAALAAAGDTLQIFVHQLLNSVPTGTDPWPVGGIWWHEWNHPGAAVTVIDPEQPVLWTPPEPILVHPAAVYAGVSSVTLGMAADVTFRLTFRYVDLSDSDYQDLFQTIIAQNVL